MTTKEARLKAIDEFEAGFNAVMAEIEPKLKDPRTALQALDDLKVRVDALRDALVKAWNA